MSTRILRSALGAGLAVALLSSCGGGGDAGGMPVGNAGLGTTAAPLAASPTPPPLTLGSAAQEVVHEVSGSGDAGGPGSVGGPGSASGPGSAGGASAASADSPSSDGAGSAGSGSSGSASTSASASGSGAGDSSGVGSGGTGVSADASSTGVGSVGGLGSIFLNGVRYDTSGAVIDLRDAAELKIGMTAKVTGPIDAGFATGSALRIESSADLRGLITGVDPNNASFDVLGTTVTTDSATVWADLPGFSSVSVGASVQVWGLPGASGSLRATRVERVSARAPAIVTGSLRSIDPLRQTFSLGGLTIGYGIASALGLVDTSALIEGTIVRVSSGAAFGGGAFVAARLQTWHAVPVAQGLRAQLAGIVTDYGSLGAFKLLGIAIDASAAQVSGGQALNIGNGVKVEVSGSFSGGVLRATRVKITNVPGTGGPSSFNLVGSVGAFRSASDFRVRGQPVDASHSGVQFVNGAIGALGNGVRVTVVGSQVSDGVLIADRVTFD